MTEAESNRAPSSAVHPGCLDDFNVLMIKTGGEGGKHSDACAIKCCLQLTLCKLLANIHAIKLLTSCTEDTFHSH